MKLKRISFLILAIAYLGSSPVSFASKVDNADRLSLLRQATGQSGTSAGSFSSRLDAILTVGADPVRDTVAREDARVRSLANQQTIDPLITSRDETRIASSEKDIREKAKKEKKKRERDSSGAVDSKVDTSEKAYRDDLEEFRKQQEQAELKKREEQQEETSQEDFQTYLDRIKKEEGEEDMAPSLSNNPFYFSPFGKSGNYTDNKSIIKSRLVQQGLSNDEAREIVNRSSSNEEIVMYLMQEEDSTYGDALEVVTF